MRPDEEEETGLRKDLRRLREDLRYGVPLARGFLAGLTSEASSLDESMRALGERIAHELRRALPGAR